MRNINSTLLSKSRTSVFIAHRYVLLVVCRLRPALTSSPQRRLKTIADADVIIVLKDGVVAEQGRHEELLAREDGVYARMWRQQNEI